MKHTITILAALLLAPLAALHGAELHVAPTGNDSNPGTESQPFATLERARDAARATRAATPEVASRIVMGGGTCARNRCLNSNRCAASTSRSRTSRSSPIPRDSSAPAATRSRSMPSSSRATPRASG